MNRFQNQIAVITGAASGIGEAIAHRLAEEGARVVLVDVQAEKLQLVAQKLQSLGYSCSYEVCNITEEQSVENTFQSVVDRFGKIEVVVHAAGIVGPTATSILDFSLAEFKSVCEVNLTGSFLVTKYAVKAMKPTNYGRIVLLASIAGKEGNPGMAGYTASKAGVIGLVKGIGKELATTGITINGIAPAVIKTAMNADTAPEQLAYMTSKIPMGRLGEVEEVAELAAFIVSKENSFSTGFIYDCSGGRATY